MEPNATEPEENRLKEQTSFLWGTLHTTFPDVDIRIQREQGSPILNISVDCPENCDNQTLTVVLADANEAVFEAIFSIKALLKHFDS